MELQINLQNLCNESPKKRKNNVKIGDKRLYRKCSKCKTLQCYTNYESRRRRICLTCSPQSFKNNDESDYMRCCKCKHFKLNKFFEKKIIKNHEYKKMCKRCLMMFSHTKQKHFHCNCCRYKR